MTKTCSTCRYWYDFWGVCCNGDSPHCADFTDGDRVCDCWEDGMGIPFASKLEESGK